MDKSNLIMFLQLKSDADEEAYRYLDKLIGRITSLDHTHLVHRLVYFAFEGERGYVSRCYFDVIYAKKQTRIGAEILFGKYLGQVRVLIILTIDGKCEKQLTEELCQDNPCTSVIKNKFEEGVLYASLPINSDFREVASKVVEAAQRSREFLKKKVVRN
jgi:hypothetical protein